MNRWNLAWLIGTPTVIILGLAFAYSAPVGRANEQDYELIRLVAEVLTTVDQNYVRELTTEQRRQLVEDMINGGLERLDPYSSFFAERDFKNFNRKSEGRFGGVGIQVTMDHAIGALFVSSPMVGTPAYEAGIQPGDLILKVNGISLEHKNRNDAVELILGEPGTKVTLTVLHEGTTKPVDVEITRAIINVPTVLGDLRCNDESKCWDFMYDKTNKIAYVRIIEFDKPTAGELKNVLEQLQKDGVRGLVIDLRGNPGGLFSAAVEISDYFLNEGTIVSTKDSRGGNEKKYVAKPGNGFLEPAVDYPIAVLVDRYSASASEIVASALKDQYRAVVVGERSFGKGSVQDLKSLEEGRSAIKLTMATYFGPSGRNIHRFPDAPESAEWGVTPSPGLEVKLTDDERRAWLAGRRYRDIVPSKNGHLPNRLKEKVEGPYRDKVLDRALEHIRQQLQAEPQKTQRDVG
jgi:carboxyl-terminal processing protease